jgi:lysine-arginine-ornithine-binding protein
MRIIKKVFLGAMMISACTALQAEQVVRIATEGAYPPYNFVNTDGSLGGFDVDIAMALCKVMQSPCKIVKQDWDGIIPGLLAKKYDAIVASMAITPKRQEKIAFSDKYEGGYSKLYGNQTLTDSRPQALQGKVIAVQTGSIQEDFAKHYYEKAGITLHRYPDTQTAMMDLTAERVDAVLLEAGLIYEAKKDSSLDSYRGFGDNFNDPKYFGSGSGIAVRKEDQALLSQINLALKTILENGTYKSINDKYFSYNQYE